MPTLALSGYPNPRQIEFFKATTRHIAYGGARGGGKSWAMRRKFVLLALNYNGLRLLLLRRTLPELRENHILPLQQELYGFARYNGEEKAFVFPNGSRIKLGYCDSESDVYQYQGHEYDVIGFEEATHFTETQKDFLTTCNRSTRADFKPRMYYSCNPGNVGHAWVKRLFIDRNYRNKERAEDYTFVPAKVWDNTVLMDNNPEYIEALENLPEELRRAHLDGDWDVFAGQYFPEFNRELHVIEAFDIPDYWTRYRSLDYGLDKTACYWYATDDNGRVYCYRELHESNLNLTQAATKILELTPECEKIKYTVASPDLWNRRSDTGMSGFEVMYKAGLKDLMKADNDRINGWRALREYLTPYKNEFDELDANLKIFRNCSNLIMNLPLLQHDEKKVEDAADTPHEITHAPESLRYFIKSRPKLSIIPVKEPAPGTHAHAFKKFMEKKDRENNKKPKFV